MAKLKVARIFLKAVRLTDGQCDSAVSVQTLPTAGWVQLKSKGGSSIEHARTTKPVGTDQDGDTGLFIEADVRNVKITLSETSFDVLTQYCIVDPDYDTDDYYFLLKSNRGAELTGVSLLIYDQDLDPTNNSNVPNLTLADQSARLFFNAVVNSSVTENANGEQDTLEVTFGAMANTGTGAASGVQGVGGRLTAV